MIERIELENFRSYKKKALDLAPNTFLVGDNGVGKTNLLEALYMLSLTNSWRTKKDNEVIHWGEPFCRIVSGNKEFVIQNEPYLKRYRLDGLNQKTVQVMGSFPSVLFQPDDVNLVYGTPGYRRHYLDRLLAQTWPGYADKITELNHVLKQRNRLLKLIREKSAEEDQLPFWDNELAVIQAFIQPLRERFTEFLNAEVPEILASLFVGGQHFHGDYIKSPHSETVLTQNGEVLPVEVLFKQHLKVNKYKELAAGVSLYGPQREDLHWYIGERSAQQTLSRGQARSLVFALKIVELAYLDRQLDRKPLLLLDDVFSELDQTRRERCVAIFSQYQTIVTTVDVPTGVKEKEGKVKVERLKGV